MKSSQPHTTIMPISETNLNLKSNSGKTRNNPNTSLGVQSNQSKSATPRRSLPNISTEISNKAKPPTSASSLKNCVVSSPKPLQKHDTPTINSRKSGTGNRSSNMLGDCYYGKTPELRKSSCPQVLIGSNNREALSTWTNNPPDTPRSPRRHSYNSLANEPIITQRPTTTNENEKVKGETSTGSGISRQPVEDGKGKPVISKKSGGKQNSVIVTKPPPITISPDSPVRRKSCADQQTEMKRFLMEIFMRSVSGSCSGGSGQQILVDQLGVSKCTDFGIADFLSQKSVEEDEEVSY